MTMLNRRTLLVSLGALTLLAVICVIGLAAATYRAQSDISFRTEKIAAAAQLLSALKDAETGTRGYILTQDPAYLQPYYDALKSLPPLLRNFEQLVQNEPEQRVHALTVRKMTAERLRLLVTTITIAQRQGLDSAAKAIRQGRGKQVMDSIRREIALFIAVERKAQDANLKALWFWQTLFLGAAASLIAVAVASVVSVTVTSSKLVEDAFTNRARLNSLLDDVLDASPDPIFVKDTGGLYTHINKACLAVMGISDGIGLHDKSIFPAGVWEKVVQDDLRVLKSGRGEMFEETVPTGQNRVLRTFLTTKSPLKDKHGNITGLLGTAKDITERKDAEERQHLLINELNHRVKNTLSVLHSIVLQTFKSADQKSKKVFEGRLSALSDAHNVLTERSWKDAPIGEVIENAVAAHCGRGSDICQRHGVDVRLSPSVALAIAMSIHELCTNAAKYGALSVPGGRIQIHWDVGVERPNPSLTIVWRESGGPPIVNPQRKGFGMRLIERSFANDADASVRMDFRESGLVCTMILRDFAAKVWEAVLA